MKRTIVLSFFVIVSLILVGGSPQTISGEGIDLPTVIGSVTATPVSESASDAEIFLPIVRAQRNQKLPSKVAYIIQDRIKKIEAALQAAVPQRTLSPQVVSELSDNLLRVNSEGEILVEFHSIQVIGPAEKADLEARGATIVISTADLVWPNGIQMSPGLGIIVAWMPHNQVETTAEQLSWVAAVRPVEDNPPDAGTFLSEGVALHNADDVQTLGIDGTGVTVGAISDGVTHLADSQALGDLPPGVTIPGACSAGARDEGTAMLEIVHDMAPGAALLFCATGGGVVNHVNAQNNLVAAGADVIAEDIPFDGEPAFQQGTAAVNGDAIAATGVSMHSSAGNRGSQHVARVNAVGTGGGPDGAVGPFADCPLTPDNVVAIAPGGDTTFDMVVIPTTTLQVTLQWSEPRAIFPTAGAGGFTDLNLYIMDAALTTCLGSSVGVQGDGAGDTIEQVSILFGAGPNVPVKIVVDVDSVSGAVTTPVIDLRWRGRAANTDAPTRDGSLNPDSNYTGLATSSAAAYAGLSTNPNTVPLEGFSSGGPVQLLLTTVCPGGVYPCPGNSIAGPAGTTVGAPNWTAADGVSVSGVGGFGSGTCPAVNQGDCRFFGTSASTPHAAACDALVRQNIGGSPSVAVINGRLAAAATDRGPAGFDNAWGEGVLDCLRATFQADLALTKTDSPDPVVAGTNLSYILHVTNIGPDDAPGVVITDTLPSGVSFSSSPDGCTETVPNSGIVTCSLASLASGASATFTVDVVVDPDLVYNAGGPITITNQASVESVAASDPDLSNNTVTEDTLVVAVADLEIVSFEAVDPPAEVLVGEPVDIILRKEITNNGPSAPMDVELTRTATAPPDSTVTPTLSVAPELALGLGELRVVDEVFTIECGAASHHTFTFTNEIQPLNPEDTDPDQSNNFATLDLEVECVVPVVINIKPGSDPNSINPRSKDVIPVAVLTTSAGEYGTPINFDATTIDPLSVRFGPRDDVWTETGGAFEAHNRGHIEDSKELDEITMDGDEDMVLHFHVRETGIEFGDTEACVKGEWMDGGSNVHKFFGCDAVRTVGE